MIRKTLVLVAASFLFISCAHVSQARAQNKHEKKCMEYFVQILDIQKFREMIGIGIEEIILGHSLGVITDAELEASTAIWKKTEEKLRQKVTNLYDVAYSKKCFEEKNESR